MIKDIPLNNRPVERLIRYGGSSLSDSEVLAIILKSGTKNESVLDLANNIINKYGSISNLKNININTLKNIKGIGEKKAASILAALELGRRVYLKEEKEKVILKNAEDIFNYTRYIFNSLMQEEFYALYFNNKQELIGIKLLFKGTYNRSLVHPREIFKEAYLESASRIVCMHNHPSGNTNPSVEDRNLTHNLIEIGKITGVPIVDHIIVSDNSYFSFYEHNILK